MCKQYFYLACAVLVIYQAESAPPPLKLCKADDTKCITESSISFMSAFVAGIPEYGVEKLDPLFIKSINASEGNLLFELKDVTLKGLNDCKIEKLSRDTPTQMSLSMVCSATLDGDYSLMGTVIFVPITGSGKAHADIRSAYFNVVIDIVDKIGEDGKKHWSIKSFKHTYELKEKCDVVFEGLFKDNEILGQAARSLIENNGNDVIKEIGTPVLTYVINRIVKNLNHMFKVMPVEDLEIP